MGSALRSDIIQSADWKLVYHDPLPKCISKGARLALIGNSAHPFLPMFLPHTAQSIQGASQAVEDGVTLAVVLQLARKSDVPHGMRTWEKIRYQRVRRAQLMGESTRDMWHKARPEDKGAAVGFPRPEWLLGFDAEKHAYEVYEATVRKIKEKGYQLPVLPPSMPVDT